MEWSEITGFIPETALQRDLKAAENSCRDGPRWPPMASTHFGGRFRTLEVRYGLGFG